MAHLVTARLAVKEHDCSFCSQKIKAGVKYLRRFYTPDKTVNPNDRGETFKECAACAAGKKRSILLEG